MQCSFNQFVFLKCNPKMALKPMADGFVCVPWTRVAAGMDTPWQYAFVNESTKMYKMSFTTEDELIDAIFDAKEIWYGSVRYTNELFNRRDEMLVMYDMANREVTP